jgi:hypothetical protein
MISKRGSAGNGCCEPAPAVVRGDMLKKLGRDKEARVEFQRAASLTRNVRERELLLERARACEAETPASQRREDEAHRPSHCHAERSEASLPGDAANVGFLASLGTTTRTALNYS